MPGIRLHHISLTCRDPLVTERWYTKHFSFWRSRVVDLGGGNQIVFIRNMQEVYLELFKATEERPVPEPSGDGYPWPSVRNISFIVTDIDEQVRGMGEDARVAFGPLDFKDWIPGWKSVWLRDPDGYLVQITQGYVDPETPPPPLP